MFRKTLAFLALALTLPLAACDDGTSAGEPGTLSLELTDAAGDFTQARVVIERIELIGDADDDNGAVVMDEPFSTNLLDLANDVATLAEDVIIGPGTYSQLRLVIPDACIGVEQEDGSEMVYATDGFDECGDADGELQTPSFDTSGLKINMPNGALEVDGDAYILLLDFDVSQSFGQEAGGSGRWVMHPVIIAEDISLTSSILVQLTVAEDVDLEALGSSLADFEAMLDTETEPVVFTDPEEDGLFTARFLYLLPDSEYEVTVGLQDDVTPYAFTLDPTSPQTISLGSGTQATLSFEVTSASPGS